MRLILFEIHKLFSKRVFVSCVVLFLVANVLILTYSQSENLTTKTIHDYPMIYSELILGCKDKTTHEALEFLDEYNSAIVIRAILDKIDTETDPKMLEMRKQYLKSQKEKNPAAYDIAISLEMSEDETLFSSILIDELKSQCKSHTSFTQGIEEMEQRAAQQKFFSIFSEDGAFANANTKKTLSDFQCMKGREVTVGNNAAVISATTFEITDYFVLALVFAACIFLFTTERDKNLYCLIRSTKMGRFPLITAKLSALGIIAVCVSIVYYLSTIATAAYYTGLGDISRTIQSVPLFYNCNLKLTIGEYLIVWVISKTAAMLAVAMLLALIFTLIKSTPTVILLCALIFGTEFIMYTVIDRNSWINLLKYINIFCLVNGNNVFGDYLNLNVFTLPVNMITIYAVLVSLMLIVSTAVTSVMFVKRSQFAKAAVWDNALDRLRTKFGGRCGRVSVFSGESYKHYKGSLVWLVLVLLVYYGYTYLNQDLTFYYSESANLVYSDYLKSLEGEITPEKEKFIADEQQKIADTYAKISELSADETIDNFQKSSMIESLSKSIENKEKGLSKVIEQYDYIKAVGKERGISPAFVDVLVYKRLLQNPVKEWRFLATLMLVIVFCSSNIFAYDYRKNMVNLIRCTKYGKMQLVLTKLSVVFITTIISYTLIYLPYMINFVRTFGSASLGTEIIFLPDFSEINSNITITQYICTLSVVHILFTFAVAVFVSMLSLILKNNTTVMIVSAVTVLVPFLVFYNNENIHLFYAFMTGKQTPVITIVVLSSIVLSAVSFFIIIKIFFPLRRYHND